MNHSPYDITRHPFHVHHVDPGMIREKSINYVNPNPGDITRLYSRTIFGPLMIMHVNSARELFGPNLASERFTIAGEPAYIHIQSYRKSKKWSTTLTVEGQHDFYRIEADRRLEGKA